MDPSYNNSFSSFGASDDFTAAQGQPAPILSPVGGDIVLPSKPKKNKVWWLLLIMVAIIAVISTGFFLFLNYGKNNGGNGSSIERYISLVVTGNEEYSNEEINNRRTANNEYLKELYYSGNENDWKNFYGKVFTLLDSIDLDGERNADKKESIELQKQLLKLFDKDKEIRSDRTGLFMDEYIQGGENQLDSYIRDGFADFENSSNSYISEYYDRINQIMLKLIDYDMITKSVECSFENETLTDECAAMEKVSWDALVSEDRGIDYYIGYVFSYYYENVYSLIDDGVVYDD